MAEALVFATSGSTGQPKTYAYAPEVLDEEIEALFPYFADRKRVVSVMPTRHLFGYVTTCLLPRRLGVSVAHMQPLPVAGFFHTLQPGDLVVAFPAFWQAVVKLVENAAFALPENMLGLTASAHCPPEVIDSLRAPGRFVNVLEIYGSTETSAVGVRTDCRGAYDLLPIWERTLLPEGDFGIVRLRRDAEKGVRREAAQELPDSVEWRGERAFVPLRRKDNAVQVGSINVYPDLVASVIRSHPAVQDCAVRLMREEEGGRLKAFIVPCEEFQNAGREVFGNAFRAWLRERLEPLAVPKSITLGAALPVNAMGKLSDWEQV